MGPVQPGMGGEERGAAFWALKTGGRAGGWTA